MRAPDQRIVRWVISGALIVCVVALYHPVLTYGVWWDDLLDLRPHTAHEVWQSLIGHWSVDGWQDSYHRPLAAIHSVLLFEIFGLNGAALHSVSLVITTAIVLLVWSWARRDGGWPLGAVVALVYLTHPVLPNSTVAWVFSQKSALAMLFVALALRLWVVRRESVSLRAWWPMAACAVAGFFYKEDTIMVLPAIGLLQAWRARVWRDVPPPSARLWLGMGGILLALALLRLTLFPHGEALDRVLSEESDWVARMELMLYPAVRALLLIRYDGEVVMWLTTLAAILLMAGTWAAWRRRQSHAAWLWTQGVVLTTLFTVPLIVALDFTTMRAHLLVLPGALMWIAGGAALWDMVGRRRVGQVIVVLVLASGVVGATSVTWMQMVHRFGACGFDVQQFSSMNEAAPDYAIQADAKRWLSLRRQVCAEGRVPRLWEEMDAIRWRTPYGRTALIAARITHVHVRVHASGGSGNASIRLEGREIARGRVASDLLVEVPLTTSWRSWLRAAHRIDVVADVPVTLTLETR